MSLRVRRSGKIVCAAENEPLKGDYYIDDKLHYILAVKLKMIKFNNKENCWKLL